MITIENIYSFRYNNPVTQNLKVWDKHPLVLPLDVTKKSILGINIHWIPKKQRDAFIEEIQRIILLKKPKSQTLRLTYVLIKTKYKRYLSAVRRYIISRITDIQIIPYTKWTKVLGIKKYRAVFHVTDDQMKKLLMKKFNE